MSSFVLVPGAGGSAWYWHLVVPVLEAAGHRAVAVDLPAADPAAGWAAYADTIVAAARDAGCTDEVVLGAASMGGFSAPVATDRLDVRRIVLVNAMVPAPGETAGDWWANTGHTEARRANELSAGRDPDAPFDEREGFFHDVSEDLTEEAFARGEEAQAEKPFVDPWPLAGWPDVPTSGIAGDDDRLFPTGFQQRVARERLRIELGVVPGGHLVSLSQPEAVAAALLDEGVTRRVG